MPERNLSPLTMFQNLAESHRPKFRFESKTKEEWKRWRDEALPKVLATLGETPKKVPLNPGLVAEWKEDGVFKRRVLIDVQKDLSAALYVFRPLESPPGKKLPAILCCHGHGPFGKEAVMGNASGPQIKSNTAEHNYDYGLQMAKAGFVTFGIDWMGFGERNDNSKPQHFNQNQGRDWCNLYYLLATMFGTTPLAMNVHHGKAAIEYVCRQPYVDAGAIGVMGLSLGGTMTTWMALADERIKAADIICYSDQFARFGYRDLNFCGSQVTPCLFNLVDLPELQGLIAPRPLLVEIGIHDTCFRIDDAMPCFRKVQAIYTTAGCRENLDVDLFEGGHAWGGNRSVDFFKRHLIGEL